MLIFNYCKNKTFKERDRKHKLPYRLKLAIKFHCSGIMWHKQFISVITNTRHRNTTHTKYSTYTTSRSTPLLHSPCLIMGEGWMGKIDENFHWCLSICLKRFTILCDAMIWWQFWQIPIPPCAPKSIYETECTLRPTPNTRPSCEIVLWN